MKRIIIALVVLTIIGGGLYLAHDRGLLTREITPEPEPTAEELEAAAKQKWIETERVTPEFQAEIADELERRYYQSKFNESSDKLNTLNEVAFNAKSKKS